MTTEPNPIKLSPNGKYSLEIESTPTGKTSWNYTKGIVKHLLTGTVIASVERNYSRFPFLFVENHPNGHDYLVCGANYQGQTVIELDTGVRKDFLPTSAKQGQGFCWAEYRFNEQHKLLTVDGCYWGGSYEYKFFDFSDPIQNGWAEIVLDPEKNEGFYTPADSDDYWPEIKADGTVIYSETSTADEPDYLSLTDEEINALPDPERFVIATRTFKLNGLQLDFVSEWTSPEEIVRRKEFKERQIAYQLAFEKYKQTDPIFLFVDTAIEPYGFDTKEHWSTGQCYQGWCPHFKGKDSRMCRRLANKRKVNGKEITIDLDWGRESAPIKLEIYENHVSKIVWFERHAMATALKYAKNVLSPTPGIIGYIKQLIA